MSQLTHTGLRRVILVLSMAFFVWSASLVFAQKVRAHSAGEETQTPQEAVTVGTLVDEQEEVMRKVTTTSSTCSANGDDPTTCAAEEKDIRVLTNLLNAKMEDDTSKIQVAKKRGEMMEDLAEKDPQAFLRNVIPKATRAKLPAAAQEKVEEKATISGTVDVLHIDDFEDEKNSRFKYTLRANGKSHALYIAGEAPALTSGSEVVISGYKIGGTLVAAGGGSGAVTVKRTPAPESVGLQNTLFILVTSPGAESTPTREQMTNTIFNGLFQKYYQEQSYSNVSFAGNVTDWIPVFGSNDIFACGIPDFNHPDIQNYLITNGIDLSRFGRVMFINNDAYGGCASVGKTNVDFNGMTYRLSFGWTGFLSGSNRPNGMSDFEYVLAHEMGHQLGAMHANAWSCTGPSLDTNCYHVEYGNSFDVMGGGWNASHFNGYYKDYLGWLNKSSKVTITKNGSYQLAPLEALSGVRAALVKNPATPAVPPLYLEYRQPIGFDRNLAPSSVGLFLNQVVAPFANQTPSTRLINANYATNPTGPEPLMPGSQFVWGSRGISVGSLTTSPTAATFKVAMNTPSCTRYGFKDTERVYPDSMSAGSSGYAQFVITNEDTVTCSASTLTSGVSVTGAGGWNTSVEPSDAVTLAPGQSMPVYANFYVSPDAPLGLNTLVFTVKDNTNGRTKTVEFPINIVPPPTITGISPTSGEIGTSITLTGSNFSNSGKGNNNTVRIINDTHYAYIQSVYSDGNNIQFTFPAQMYRYGNGTQDTLVPTPDGSYTIQVVRGNDGSTSNGVSFNVGPLPTLTLTISQPYGTPPVVDGESATMYPDNFATGWMVLKWSSTNATECIAADGWAGVKLLNNPIGEQLYVNTNKKFALTCTGVDGSVTKSVIVYAISSPQSSLGTLETLAATVRELQNLVALYTQKGTVSSGSVSPQARASLDVASQVVNFTGLRNGSDEARVSDLKRILNTIPVSVSSGCVNLRTGNTLFGPTTEACVQAFQGLHGLVPTGVVDGATNRALNEVVGIR